MVLQKTFFSHLYLSIYMYCYTSPGLGLSCCSPYNMVIKGQEYDALSMGHCSYMILYHHLRRVG